MWGPRFPTQHETYVTRFLILAHLRASSRILQTMNVLVALLLWVLSLVPSWVGMIPLVGGVLAWVWAWALYIDNTLDISALQRRAVARVLASAQVRLYVHDHPFETSVR